jgi:sec-independent protein translocase protein TatC
MSPAKRRQPTDFQRAADGSMPLVEHIRELRSRLFKASLAIMVAAIGGYMISGRVQDFIDRPYCQYVLAHGVDSCRMNAVGVLDPFMLQLKVALYVGIVVAAPIWTFQLWRFIAPGLLKRERRYAYGFAGGATPLFIAGCALGYVLLTRSLPFFLGSGANVTVQLDITGYFDFVTLVMLVFGLGFELPLLVLMFNLLGVVSARQLLRWWRPAIFLMFLFAAIVTPTPEPFSMTILALCIAVLYFGAVGLAFIFDGRRAKRRAAEEAAATVGDDQVSPIEPISPVDAPTWGVHGNSDPDQ